MSGSTAVFNIDLTENGAAFMHELFVGSGGTGRIDLTPVQVLYTLRMWARLPPVVITVTGDSERIHSTLLKVSESNRDNPCTPSEVETYRENGTNSSRLKETGMVVVKIDKGDAMVPDDVLQALQQYALDLFDTMIKERFLVPAASDAEPLGFDADDPGIGERDPNVSVAGSVRGNVRAAGNLILEVKAIVYGDISAQRLVIDDGAVFDGSCVMTGGGEETAGERAAQR